MFALTESHRFHIYTAPTDMRKGFNGLCGLVDQSNNYHSTNGDVYIFMNRSRNRLKLLHWESGGFVLYYKQLEQGSFPLDFISSNIESSSIEISFTDLALMVDGIIIQKSIRRKRFSL